MDKTRCHWFDESNEIISKYHDEEFGILNIDDDYLFEMINDVLLCVPLKMTVDAIECMTINLK